MMNLGRYLVTAAVAMSASACCDRGSPPGPPHGTPDDTSRFSSGEYESVNYTYYCYNGRYVSIDYVSTEPCDDWHEGSRYTSDGICGGTRGARHAEALRRFGVLNPASEWMTLQEGEDLRNGARGLTTP
jgi:hypothetical protein